MMSIIGPIVLGLGLIASIIGGLIYKGKQDNPIEETAEAIVYIATGEDVDFTPTSPEKNKPLFKMTSKKPPKER